mmetsp:Transcript_19610/g.28801  ORF Transcript_19610/g.28801 Transcript_19610/m.28801 type:complete len:432 (-) Transcript_19610:181-1476(-)|eukprot:CAMPEP_0179435838 /NCGR_PEP_ID=MMETSP0799-20121207/19881_1 /TAXON_ID=46947 /ORGANISM="Geminigera cryophila, Strain CCMP2564" /LENGTH=431 /DNA_ID=CAMNT_0021215475 /DNA_START=66 /DNA_END=1361 /DNA_ORIENTATION=-
MRHAASSLLVLCAVGSASAFVAPALAPAPRVAASASVGRAVFATGKAFGTSGRARTPQGLIGLRAEADYYADLGIARGADEREIKSAFRNKARKLHPDVNKAPDAQQQFQGIQQAYEVLSDPQKKSMYDRFGEAGVKGAGGGGGGAGFQDFGDFSPFGDIFETFFGGGGQGGGGRRRQQGPQQGDDLRLDLEIDFMTAVFGGEEKIRISHLETCDTCTGSGIKAGTKPRTCSGCNGQGVVMQVVRTPLGMLQQQSACPQCQGTGEIVDEYCGTCTGRGRVQKNKQLKITIPAGVDNGSRLRIRKEGDAGPKAGPPGDLYVFLTVKTNKDFKREGSDIYSQVRISYVDAILGTSIKVATVDGDVDLKVAAGTQPETVTRLDAKGAPKLGGKGRGDHFVTIKVDIPTSVSSADRELLTKLKEGTTAGKGFFSK